MTPIDIQVSRSKVKVKGHAYSLNVGEGGALVFYKHLYLLLGMIIFYDTNKCCFATLINIQIWKETSV